MGSPVNGSAAWYRRLHVRQAALLASVALGSALLAGVPLYVQAARLLEQVVDDRLEGVAELGAIALLDDERRGGEATNALLATIRDEADLDAACLLDRSGRPVGMAADRPELCLVPPEDAALLTNLAGEDSAHTNVRQLEDGAAFLFAFAPLSRSVDGASIVAVRASAPYLERLVALRRTFLAAGIAGGVLVALIGAWIAKRLVRPVEQLVAATGRLAEGNAPEQTEPATTLELAKLQDAFNAMSLLVRAREQSLRALAGAVAHEVKNPAHALRLHLGLLRRETRAAGAELFSGRLDTLQKLLDELDATVDGFLLFARDRVPRRQLVNLRALLESAARGAEVRAADIDVNVDPLLVGRAVANLVLNAQQVGSERVVVRGQCADEILIEVEDAGPGFPEELVATAFEPFVAGRRDGTGLGLAIVSSVARAHGGSARITRSAPGCTIVELKLSPA